MQNIFRYLKKNIYIYFFQVSLKIFNVETDTFLVSVPEKTNSIGSRQFSGAGAKFSCKCILPPVTSASLSCFIFVEPGQLQLGES